MKVLINNKEFNLHEYSFPTSTSLALKLDSESAEEIKKAAGKISSIVIPNEYEGKDYVLISTTTSII